MYRHAAISVVPMLVIITAAGCSTPPKQTVDTVSPAAQASAAPAAQSSAPAAPAASAATAADPAKPVPREIPSGYKLTKRNGREVYCRSVVPIGSKLAEEMCFTREQLEEISRRRDSAVGSMEQGMKVCAPGGTDACGGK